MNSGFASHSKLPPPQKKKKKINKIGRASYRKKVKITVVA